jgi:hypothetical protein
MNGHEAKTLREIHTDVITTNARLRAQRDELLAALETAFLALGRVGGHTVGECSPSTRDAWLVARAVIAKVQS